MDDRRLIEDYLPIQAITSRCTFLEDTVGSYDEDNSVWARLKGGALLSTDAVEQKPRIVPLKAHFFVCAL